MLFFSYSVMSDSLWPHGLQNARFPCPSLCLGTCSNSCPFNWWYYAIISYSVTPLPPAFNLPQNQDLFQWTNLCIRWPKYWSFSFSISPSNEYSGLISFWSPCCPNGSQGLCQHHSSKASILWCSASLMVQLSQWYMTNGKAIALIIQIFVSKLMSLFVIAFLPWSKNLLISWLWSLSTVILSPRK